MGQQQQRTTAVPHWFTSGWCLVTDRMSCQRSCELVDIHLSCRCSCCGHLSTLAPYGAMFQLRTDSFLAESQSGVLSRLAAFAVPSWISPFVSLASKSGLEVTTEHCSLLVNTEQLNPRSSQSASKPPCGCRRPAGCESVHGQRP